MSTYAKKDKEVNEKILSMKKEYEEQIDSFRTGMQEAEKKFKDTQQQLWDEQRTTKDLTKRAKEAEKEVDNLKRDLQKRERVLQGKIDEAIADKKSAQEA